VFGARSETEFYEQLAKGVLKATSTRLEDWLAASKQFLGRLRPKIELSADPAQAVSLGLDWDEARENPAEILDLAENIAQEKGLRIVVCVDEFQSIADYRDSLAFQRRLRSHWQRHQRVCYCLYGSKRHMLGDLFSNPDLPFYRFGDIMILEKIDNAIWGEFIHRRFADTGKQISLEDSCYLAACVDNHSYYVQQLAQLTWFRALPDATATTVDIALNTLKDQLGLLFASLAESLTAKQMRLLKAVLADEKELSSQATIARYGLGTSAHVTRMKESLRNREILDVIPAGVEFLDPVFKHWLKSDIFRS
jgi:hypothetical protein